MRLILFLTSQKQNFGALTILYIAGIKGTNIDKFLRDSIVYTLPFSAERSRAEPPTKFSERGALKGSQLLEGVAEKEGVTFFRGGGIAIFT